MNKLILAIILSMVPISELRVGMPLAIIYAQQNNLSLIPIISLIILANILIVFFIFFFLDHFHNKFMELKAYKKFYLSYLKRIQHKVDKFEKRHAAMGFVALSIFVGIPIPTTGAWTGTIIAWLLGLDRKKSIIAIAIGVVMAGIIMALGSLGIIGILGLL